MNTSKRRWYINQKEKEYILLEKEKSKIVSLELIQSVNAIYVVHMRQDAYNYQYAVCKKK